MQVKATMEFWQKGDWVIARIPELDFVTQGRSLDEAKSNIKEVMRIQFEEMRELGTLGDYLAECGFEIKGDIVEPVYEMIGFEKQFLRVD